MERTRSLSLCVVLFVFSLSMQACDGRDGSGTSALGSSRCEIGEAEWTDGHRRLALVVGVGDYQAQEVSDLDGPPEDARRFYDLLTRDKGGYGFPEKNVCLLLDDRATTAGFQELFRKALIDRTENEEDVAVFYFAGHGSQRRDRNRDEPDEWDETLLLHDSRTKAVPGDFPDDELNELLAELRSKTKHIAVVLDSCSSGSATRVGPGGFVARFQSPAEEPLEASETRSGGDEGASWVPEELDGLVAFVAATDGTSALERNGRGLFTDALLTVLSRVGQKPLTYAQAARQIPPLVAANSYQVPLFEGDLSRVVFENTSRDRPASWEVTSVAAGDIVELSGPPLPGLGVGAELRLYDGSADAADAQDPANAKALAVVTKATDLNARARIVGDGSDIERGDLAVMARVGDAFARITVTFRPDGLPGGVPRERGDRLRTAIESDRETNMLVTITEGGADFELSLSSDGVLQLRGPENRIRNRYERDHETEDVPKSLWQHARQRAVLQLHGEVGGDFVDQETLQVQLVPARSQIACADGEWIPSEPNEEQVIPLCHQWNIKVTLREDAPKPLLVGGLVLSNDGAMVGFPADGRRELLHPGEEVVFDRPLETFRASAPLDVQDHVLVFGTQRTNPVDWRLFTETAGNRSAASTAVGSLHRAIDRYLQPGTRSASATDAPEDETTWTVTRVAIRVEANSHFLTPEQADAVGDKQREYTIPSFDVRPYLPDDEESALYQVLMSAHSLATFSSELQDGIPYKQHDWSQPSDPANLAVGIDCSRAIWFAFTRADLPYNDENDRYLHTGIMVGDDGPMAQRFQSCNDDPGLQLGDILVYRDDARRVGHTVMVIDSGKRIAWGSHGWDGNVKEGLESDTGVEYQLIKYKKDWERWDRSTMQRKACWRYRRFNEEDSQPGLAALLFACDAGQSCALPPTPVIGGVSP
ncbi:MAG: caspase family protein [Vicinamibacteria bacterium]